MNDALARGLARLNVADEATAVEALLACCASHPWARRMAAQRPFPIRDALFAAAEHTWWQLHEADWREAFAAHPRIGEREPAGGRKASGGGDRGHAWSAGEQAGAADMEAQRAARLAEVNRRYEERFGHVYLVCATGKSGDEMLAIAERRLADEAAHELRVAAAEQAKITRLRLEKLLAEMAEDATQREET